MFMCVLRGESERERVEVGFHSASNKSVRWNYSHFSFAATVAHFQCVLICYLYYTSIKAKGTFHARPPWGVTAFPWTSLQCLICNASPTAPLHYVAFASYCLCIASARLVPFSLPPLPFFPLVIPPPLSLSPVSGWCQSAAAWQ